MLLGFLVALSLKSKSIGTTRTQLYQRLFELIEESLSQRHKNGGVENVVMMRFLEILGWHLLVNPHETLKQTLERCARDIALELHEPMLKAKMICEQCVRRWEDLGMLERVRFQSIEAITFVHKTFSEYAAARQFAQLDPEVQNNALNAYSKEASWAETIKFSCSMGLVERVIDTLLTTIPQGKTDAKVVDRAAEFLNECDVKVSGSVIEMLIDYAWKCVLSANRWVALQAGFSLSSIASRYPTDVSSRAKDTLSHQQPWTRLSAWACVTEAGSHYYAYQAMLDMLKLLPSDDYRFKKLQARGLWLNDPRPKIIEGFVLSATKVILAHDDPIGLAVLDEILSQDIGQTVGFNIAMSKLLEPRGKRLPKSYSLDWEIPWLTQDWKKCWRDQYISLLGVLDDPSVIVNIDEPIDDNNALMHMSGFMDASSYWEVSAGDIWKRNFGKEAAALKEVLHAIAIISGIERDRLINDVRILKASLEKQVDDDLLFYDRLVHVDTQPNWELAPQLPLSLESLEIALFQRSDWVIVVATNLLGQKATTEEIFPIIGRLLEKGKGNTLFAAAHLMSHIDVADALLMVRNRLLGTTMSDGCEALFEKLGELDNTMEHKDTFQCIKNGLLCTNPKVAIAAAGLISKHDVCATMDIVSLISKAYRHWQVNEEPYPVSGGVIPDSPRSLLAKTILQAGIVDDNELISMATDSRSDVKEVSKEPLRERLDQSESFRDLFLREIINGKLELDLLSNALKDKTQFSTNQCALIRRMLQHDNATIRYAAIPILVEPYSTVEEIKQHLQILSQDSEADIREIASELSTQ